MALVKYSGLVAAISGKVGGAVFKKGRGSSVVQSSPHYCKKSSEKNLLSRRRLSRAQHEWISLSSDDRKNWEQLAKIQPETSRVGTSRLLTGRQLFIRYYIMFLLFDPITPFELPVYASSFQPLSITLAFDASNFYANVTTKFYGVLPRVIWFGARSFSTSGFSRLNYIFLKAAPYDAETPVDLLPTFTAALGTPSSGELLSIMCRGLSRASLLSPTVARTFTFPQTD